jgi:UDP-N-acetylglucosamine 4,6-dehydratase
MRSLYSKEEGFMKVLILGGSGTLGQELTRALIKKKNTTVTILSRDELKQVELRKKWGPHPRLKWVLGDIRDAGSIARHFRNIDTVFHVAALKHVDVLEENPEESIETNILGSTSVAQLCEVMGVKHAIFSSTDKAVDPINVYGYSKALAEKVWLSRRSKDGPNFKVYRWGNVMGSRGSAVMSFVQSLKKDRVAYITDPKMTRYWITIRQAVEFMLSTYREPGSKILIPPLKAAAVKRVIDSIARVLEIPEFKLIKTGMRPGEKLHEVMTSIHQGAEESSETAPQYTDQELDALLTPILEAACPS